MVLHFSPRHSTAVHGYGLFPAHAGVILLWGQSSRESLTFPRTRGGDPEFFRDENVDNALFPAYAGVILKARSPTLY